VVPALNYHHLRHFRAVAQDGSLTRAARRLHVAQSALSIQIAALEAALGEKLFDRGHRRMTLTEAGRIALAHAETIFQTGDELLSTLAGRGPARQVLRVGAQATLSRNFQITLLRPLLAHANVTLVLRSASLAELLAGLAAHTLDLVLSTVPIARDAATPWQTRTLADFPVALVGRPAPRGRRLPRLRLPDDLATVPLLLPSLGSAIRTGFDQLLAQAGVVPRILAEVDDMAMLRLLAREGAGLALVPAVVVQDELTSGALVQRAVLPGIRERFFAITTERRFPNALLQAVLGRH
jgi:LysR family transcriptional activator of nhaA